MSLPAMSLGLRFCSTERGGGWDRWVSTLAWDSMAASGLSCKKP